MKPQITCCRSLSETQKLQIAAFVEQCCRHDHTKLVYPLEEKNCSHYLMTSPQGELLAVLGLILYPHSHVECSAFTAPEHRQKGYFYDLMNEAEDEYEAYDVMFLVDEACKDTVAAMEALGAEMDHHEIQMEFRQRDAAFTDSPDSLPAAFAARAGSESSDPDSSLAGLCLVSRKDRFVPQNLCWELFQEEKKGKKLLGSCQTLSLSPSHVCLHHMEIPEKLQGQGYGTCLVRLLKEALAKDGITRILLQVSDDNSPAMALYKKEGFQVTETLACYLY